MSDSTKPSILYISHERKLGGASMSLCDLVTEMRRRGYRVCVVVLQKGCPVDVKLRELGIDTFHCFFGWWMQPKDWNPIIKIAFRFLHWMQWLSVIRLSRYVRKQKINVIHSISSVIDIGAQVAAQTGCKHVWHFREFGDLDYRLEYNIGKNKALNYVNAHADRVIFISKALERSYPEIINKTQIYNGVRDEAFCDIKTDRSPRDEFGFLISGNLSEGKNQMLVLEAVKIIQEFKRPYIFKLYVAGAATSLKQSQKYEHRLKQFVKDNSIDNVIFLGFVSNMKELRNSKIDVEIVASRSEAYGRVTIEAMASGDLVLAADSGSNPELIGNNEHGVLFKDNDPVDLSEKMIWCMDNAEKIRRIEECAYNYAFEEHRMIYNVSKVEGVYSSLTP